MRERHLEALDAMPNTVVERARFPSRVRGGRSACRRARDGRGRTRFGGRSDGKRWERRKARTATTEKPVCETRAAGAGARSCAPAKAPVRESPAMLRRPAIVRVVCCVHVCARKCRAEHPRATRKACETWLFTFAIHTFGRRPKNSRIRGN